MRSQRRGQAGFTLIEMMTVVLLTGILATIAVYGVKKYVMSAKTSEAVEMIGAIKAAQETYKDETFTYLNVSSSALTQASAYPAPPFKPGRQKEQWGGGTGAASWAQLGVSTASPVTFAYACTAGAANGAPTPPSSDSGNITITNWPASVASPWYVVKAYADLSGSGNNFTVFVGTSFAGDIYSNN